MNRLLKLSTFLKENKFEKEFQILKKVIAYCSGFSFAWISGDGKFYEINKGDPFTGDHLGFAMEYLKTKGIDFNKVDPEIYLYDKGWIKVSNAFDFTLYSLPIPEKAAQHLARVMGNCVYLGSENIEKKQVFLFERRTTRTHQMCVADFVQEHFSRENQDLFYAYVFNEKTDDDNEVRFDADF